MHKRKIIPLLVIILLPLAIYAHIYYWVDVKGVKHYSSSPPESKVGIRDYQVVETVSEISTPETNEQAETTGASTAPQKKAYPKVVMYSTPGDKFCDEARTCLKTNKIPFQERDVKKDTSAMREYKNLQGTGFPLFIIGDNWLQGWSEETVRGYLGMKK